MKILQFCQMICGALLLNACAIKTPTVTQYKLETFSRAHSLHKTNLSILVSQPDAVAGYQTEQMRYITKLFALNSFAHNAWVGTPASMLFPLILQTLQYSGYFHAVAQTPYADRADYRLDTQVIALHQCFLTKPSTEDLTVKFVLTHVADNRVVGSRIVQSKIKCPTDTPYGGVIAANQAVREVMKILTNFVIQEVTRDQK